MKEKLLITGGCLIDRERGYRYCNKDILVEKGIITKIADRILKQEDMEVLELSGEYVAPGFIDGHVHVYGAVDLGVPADEIGIEKGTTTMIDAGSAGPENIGDFIEKDIKTSKTRIYAAMHYAKTGLSDPPEADAEDKYDLDLVKEAYQKYQAYIVAIKARASNSCVGQLGITSITAGKEAAKGLGLPYLVHIGNMPPTIEEVLGLMEEGDIITHAFHGKKNNLFTAGEIKPETQAARDRGVLFDVGHGKASFNFNVGKMAKKLDFVPDIISTDLHAENYLGPVYSLSITIDKMLALGYPLEFCIDRVTDKPARYYGLEQLGKLEEGCFGDFTIFRIREGEYQFRDADGNDITGKESIEVQYAVVDGKIVMKKEEIKAGREEEILERVRTELELAEADYQKYRRDIQVILNYLKKQKVVFPEDNKLAFLAHVVTLFMRLETGEKVPDMGGDVLSQLDPHAVRITEGMMAAVANMYQMPDEAETALVAIHIHTALEIMQENE